MPQVKSKYKSLIIDHFDDNWGLIRLDYRESIKQHEDIIQNLQIIIKEHLKNTDSMRDKEIKVSLEKLRYEGKVLSEKHKQVILSKSGIL